MMQIHGLKLLLVLDKLILHRYTTPISQSSLKPLLWKLFSSAHDERRNLKVPLQTFGDILHLQLDPVGYYMIPSIFPCKIHNTQELPVVIHSQNVGVHLPSLFDSCIS